VRPDDFPGSPPREAAEGRDGVSFAIDRGAAGPLDPAQREPQLALVPAGDTVEEMARLDPSRATPEREPPPAGRQRGLALGVLGSVGVHLLPLLLLLDWTIAPAELAVPIPVQLVIEAPPPPPPPPPPKAEEFKPPPPGRLASEEMGHTASPPPETPAAAPPAPTQPAPTQLAALAPPPPKPIRPPKPAVPAFEWHRLDTLPQTAPRATRVPGPAATRDEYLAFCMVLIRRHLGALSPAFLAGRHGVTLFRLMVLDDGTIARITLAHPSPHPEIDARIEEAVNAVGRFPPLPQWLQGPSAGLILQVIYPEGL
jgi:periplasmic protein TonB